MRALFTEQVTVALVLLLKVLCSYAHLISVGLKNILVRFDDYMVFLKPLHCQKMLFFIYESCEEQYYSAI